MRSREYEQKEEKLSGEISYQSNSFVKWLDNFWYHYKWHTIGILFAVIVLTVCILQTCSKEEYDLTLVYAGPVSMTAEQLSDVERLLDQKLPEDFDQSGEKNAALSRYTIYSAEQMKELDEKGFSLNRQQNTSEHDNYSNYLLTGESSVYLLDPWLYESLRSADRLRSVSEVCGDLPQGALEDGFGVRLGETELYQKYDVLKVLPEDTVICLLRQQVMGKSHDDEHYEAEEAMFRSLVSAETVEREGQ